MRRAATALRRHAASSARWEIPGAGGDASDHRAVVALDVPRASSRARWIRAATETRCATYDAPSPSSSARAQQQQQQQQRRGYAAATDATPAPAGKVDPSSAAAASRRAMSALADKYDRTLVENIYRSSFKNQTGVSLKYMLDFGSQPIHRQLMVSAQFLHKELPVRFAHRVAELENLPLGLSSKAQVQTVRDWYVESYDELLKFPTVKTNEDEEKFTELIKRIMERHANVVPMIARGVLELKMEMAEKGGTRPGTGKKGLVAQINDLPEIQQFLDGFYMSRIGIRMLIGQHVALHEKDDTRGEDYIGLIHTKMSPLRVARDAIDDARSICMRQYGDAPEVEVFGDESFTFAYEPGHLHQMLFELVKNSLRAVSDKYADSDDDPPPIRLVIAEGAEDVTIKISDEGGGIRRSGLQRIWTYLYTTADSPLLEMDEHTPGPVVLAGYGYGLPLSRLYARYFGGDLQVISMDGYGTDAYLHFNRLGNVQEPLP